MSQSWYDDVLQFHIKLAPDKIGTTPAIPDGTIQELRMRMIFEELNELQRAYTFDDLPKIADAIGDLIYVLIGMAISYGIDLRPVWDAIQAANMAKEGGATRDDGKCLKPPGWKEPDIAGILARQSSLRT